MKVKFLQSCVIFTLLALGMVALFVVPQDDSPTWGRDLILSKCLAVFFLVVMDRYAKRTGFYSHQQ